MFTKKEISRSIIAWFTVLPLLWFYNGIIFYYGTKVNNSDCENSFRIYDCTVALLVLLTVANFGFTLQLFYMISYFKELTHIGNGRSYDLSDQHILFIRSWSYCLYMLCSIPSQILFFRSSLMSGSKTVCTTEDSELLFRLIIYGFIWIGFLLYIVIIISFLRLFFSTFGEIIKEADLCDCLKTFKIRSSSAITPSSPYEKQTQTEEVSIPIGSIKNEQKPFTCIICMSNQIDTIIFPCFHLCMCNDCYKQFSNNQCPCCKKSINEVKTIYLAPLENNNNYNFPTGC